MEPDEHVVAHGGAEPELHRRAAFPARRAESVFATHWPRAESFLRRVAARWVGVNFAHAAFGKYRSQTVLPPRVFRHATLFAPGAVVHFSRVHFRIEFWDLVFFPQ
jgi:hypothetical protein